MTTREGWSDTRDDSHPIRWESADGTDSAYLTRAEAIRRLSAYYIDAEPALDSGATVRTPFAFYTVTEPEPDDGPIVHRTAADMMADDAAWTALEARAADYPAEPCGYCGGPIVTHPDGTATHDCTGDTAEPEPENAIDYTAAVAYVMAYKTRKARADELETLRRHPADCPHCAAAQPGTPAPVRRGRARDANPAADLARSDQ
jgi:hypothetical protein